MRREEGPEPACLLASPFDRHGPRHRDRIPRVDVRRIRPCLGVGDPDLASRHEPARGLLAVLQDQSLPVRLDTELARRLLAIVQHQLHGNGKEQQEFRRERPDLLPQVPKGFLGLDADAHDRLRPPEAGQFTVVEALAVVQRPGQPEARCVRHLEPLAEHPSAARRVQADCA